MSDERVVTLRFQEQRAMDMELYRRLEDGKKETGLSMPAYVKGLLRQHFKSAERAGTDVGVEACMERIREIVHGELACQGAVLAGTLEKIAEGFPERMKNAAQTGGPPESGEALPGDSDSFPEGFDSVLERVM